MATNETPWHRFLPLMAGSHPFVEMHLPGGVVCGKLHKDVEVAELWYIESSAQGGCKMRHYFLPEQVVRCSVKRAAPAEIKP
jgi:hypothetical protein